MASAVGTVPRPRDTAGQPVNLALRDVALPLRHPQDLLDVHRQRVPVNGRCVVTRRKLLGRMVYALRRYAAVAVTVVRAAAQHEIGAV